MNSANTSTTEVVTRVWVARTSNGCGALCQSDTPNTHSPTRDPDSMPQSTRARLLPTNMEAMKSWGRAFRKATTRPRQLWVASSSVWSRLEATNAISIPEKNADANSDSTRIRIELEGSGSMQGKIRPTSIGRRHAQSEDSSNAVPKPRNAGEQPHGPRRRVRAHPQPADVERAHDGGHQPEPLGGAGRFVRKGLFDGLGIGHGANVGQQDESQFPTSNDPVGFRIS